MFLKKLYGNLLSVSNLEVSIEDFMCITSPAICQPDYGGGLRSGLVAVLISVRECVCVCLCACIYVYSVGRPLKIQECQ